MSPARASATATSWPSTGFWPAWRAMRDWRRSPPRRSPGQRRCRSFVHARSLDSAMASVALLSWLDGLRGRWSAAGRQVALDRLISPLRYDILVRAEFFRFHGEHAALYDHSLPDYLAAAQSHSYFLWFTEVYVRRFHPELAGNPRALLDAFADRVRRSVELFRSFEARGFDSRHPIVLRSGRTILPTETGKVVSATVFAGNGCHRLALLLARGVRWLEPGTYVVKRTPTFRPLDNTALLLPVLRLSEAEYC